MNAELAAEVAPYERLAELAEAELAACEGQRPLDLPDLYAEADKIRATLTPGGAPAEAETALRRAAFAQARIADLLSARLAERGTEMGRVQLAREAAHAYAMTANAGANA